MTDTTIPAAAQLQSWLDGTSVLSKAAVRAVLWDLAEAQTRLAGAYETKTDYPECPDCGNDCGGHAPETYHVDCGENVTDCECSNRPAPVGRSLILGEINAERFRQIAKFGKQHCEDGTGGPVMARKADEAKACCEYLAKHGGVDWRAVLLEEVFEAMAESDLAKLRAELVQTSAVCVAWIEDIDSRAAGAP